MSAVGIESEGVAEGSSHLDLPPRAVDAVLGLQAAAAKTQDDPVEQRQWQQFYIDAGHQAAVGRVLHDLEREGVTSRDDPVIGARPVPFYYEFSRPWR